MRLKSLCCTKYTKQANKTTENVKGFIALFVLSVQDTKDARTFHTVRANASALDFARY